MFDLRPGSGFISRIGKGVWWKRPLVHPRASNRFRSYRVFISGRASRHSLLRIFDPAVKPALRRAAVERHGEIAKRVCRVRGPVVHRMRAQRLQLVVLIGAVELERVDAARAFGRIEPAVS